MHPFLTFIFLYNLHLIYYLIDLFILFILSSLATPAPHPTLGFQLPKDKDL